MPLPAYLEVGPQIGSDGAIVPARAGKTGETVVSELNAPYYENAYRGNTFAAANVAAQAVSVALATTYTGLCLSNPLGNNRNFVLLTAGFALSVAPAAIASLHLIAGYSATTNVTHTTPLAAPGIQNAMIGNQAISSAKVDSAATIVNPGYLLPIANGFTAAALPGSNLQPIDLKGQYILTPGAWIAIGALTAVTGFGALTWAEVPV